MRFCPNRKHWSSQHKGFSLSELLVVVVIVGLTTAWSLPNIQRNLAQAKVDRYWRNVETGLFNLRARMGAFKGSCEVDFSVQKSFKLNQFVPPDELLEALQQDGSRSSDDVLAACRRRFIGDPSVNEKALRLVNLEGTREREAVEVATRTQTFFFTPPGTTSNDLDMVLLIRSRQANASWAINEAGNSRLRTRCVEVTGNGQVFAGTWSESSKQCRSR